MMVLSMLCMVCCCGAWYGKCGGRSWDEKKSNFSAWKVAGSGRNDEAMLTLNCIVILHLALLPGGRHPLTTSSWS